MKFSEKHGPNAKPDPALESTLNEIARDGGIGCAEAIALAYNANADPAAVGRTVDLCGLRLTKCQLGLFGYKPNKKIVKAAPTISSDLKTAILDMVHDGRISCAQCWEIAGDLDISKMSVSSACETLSIKIKPCQLGAF